MYLAKETKNILDMLKSNEYFSDKKVIMAYPFAKKPTRLADIVVTISPSSLSAKNIEAGGESLFGSYKIDADIFVPQDMGSPCVFDVIEKTVNTVIPLFPCAVSVSEIYPMDELFCFTAKCSFTFSSEIDFGGENYE